MNYTIKRNSKLEEEKPSLEREDNRTMKCFRMSFLEKKESKDSLRLSG